MIAPTLLVGLGGTGSKIVCRVSKMVTEEQRRHIGFAVFDTDINELREIQEENPFIKTIQTSTKMTVGGYLNIDTHARDTWFPVNGILNSKTLTEGAAQVRAISRLALDTAIRRGSNMEALHNAIEELYRLEGDSGEQALDIVDALVRSSAVDIIVVDSVAALTPKAEIEGDMGDSHVGLQARLMSQALRKLTAIVNKSKTCVVFINQLREKVGVMFGNPEVTPGGKALKFYASIRIDVRKTDILKDTDGAAGNRTRAKVVKNKLAPPFRQAEFDIMYGEGVSQEGCIIDLGVQYDVIKKSGAWYSYNDNKVANGRERMRQFLKDNPELAKEMEDKIRAAAKGAPVESIAGGEE